ncbi:MAG: hypothetical protein KBT10_02315 [Bacteroidales bacterium]|nr:hypothetical protein [Candidatus Sodaliphilus aphodohippi]
MALTINLFVHGVPMGQKIWGCTGDDLKYIETFYGPSYKTAEQMIVEAKSLGGSTNCYYTYIKSQNVLASDGRAGAYIALTLKINMYYTDVVNMYNVLKAAFDKMLVGSVVKTQGDNTKFCIQDFKQVDSQLKEIEQAVVDYLMKFSDNNDLCSLSGIAANGNMAAECINILESDVNKCLQLMKRSGKLAVSNLFPTSQVKTVLAQKETEIQNLKTQCQTQIDTVNQQKQVEVQGLKQQLNQADANTKRQLDALNKKYAEELERLRHRSPVPPVGEIRTDGPYNYYSSKRKSGLSYRLIATFVNTILLLIIILMLLFMRPGKNKSQSDEIPWAETVETDNAVRSNSIVKTEVAASKQIQSNPANSTNNDTTKIKK